MSEINCIFFFASLQFNWQLQLDADEVNRKGIGHSRVLTSSSRFVSMCSSLKKLPCKVVVASYSKSAHRQQIPQQVSSARNVIDRYPSATAPHFNTKASLLIKESLSANKRASIAFLKLFATFTGSSGARAVTPSRRSEFTEARRRGVPPAARRN